MAAKAPQEKRAREGEATALILLGKLDAAKASLEAAVTDLPNEMALKHALARILVAGPEHLRDPARGFALASEVFKAEPTIDRVETLAMAAAAQGQFELGGAARKPAGRRRRTRRPPRPRRPAAVPAGPLPRRQAFRAAGPGDLIVSPPLLDRAGAEARES